MERTGPLLETLTRRLAATPPDFLAAPCLGGTGEVAVAALVHDVLQALGVGTDAAWLEPFSARAPQRDGGFLGLAVLLAWLLADDWCAAAGLDPGVLRAAFTGAARELAADGDARRYVSDEERREECARFVLARLGLRPAGESAAQAADRLSRVSRAERRRLLAASRAAEERARQVREALARRAAQEAADKWTRE